MVKVIELISKNLIQVRKQRRKDQNDSDPMEIRVRKLKQISPRVRQIASNPLPQQVREDVFKIIHIYLLKLFIQLSLLVLIQLHFLQFSNCLKRIAESLSRYTPLQAVLITRRKTPTKPENVILPALSRRRKSFEQKNLPAVPEIENKTKVLPAIESKSKISSTDPMNFEIWLNFSYSGVKLFQFWI